MEINKQESIIPILSKVYETAVEQGVDTEFTLPDYYPEISKILKIISVVNISSSKCDNGDISVGGQTVLTVLYFGNDENLNSYTYNVPFVKSIDASPQVSGAVTVETKINYINSKVVSPRKIEIHGAISLNISVNNISENSFLSHCECEGVFTKNAGSMLILPMSPITKSVFVDDEVSVSEGKKSIGKILRSSANALIDESKYVSGKVVIKGAVLLELLCLPSDNGRPFIIKESRGFSQIIDCDAAGEIITFDVFPHIENIELRPKTSLDGEVRTVAFEAKVGIDVLGYYAQEVDYISDAFSCKYSTNILREKFEFIDHVSNLNDKYLCEKEFDFTGVLKEVLDLHCNALVDYCASDGNDVVIKGNIPVSIIGIDTQGEYGYFEKILDFEYRCGFKQTLEKIKCRPVVNVVATDYHLNNDGVLKLSVELKVEANVFCATDIRAVSAVEVDCDNIINKADNSAVTLYFAENESSWEIAQKYGVSPKSICEVNNLGDIDMKYKGVLLIPCM